MPHLVEFAKETFQLLPFLFGTYLVLEAVEARSDGAAARFLARSRLPGPLVGALAGILPQCGVSAAAASLFAGGAVTAGTLVAVMLSTSDELLPVLISAKAPLSLMAKVVGVKAVCAAAAGFALDVCLRRRNASGHRHASVAELCAHSRCGCSHHRGILVPALIHTAEIFAFIVLVSGAIELAMHFFGEGCLERLCLNTPVLGELAAGALGLVPNCAVSVVGAKLYLGGAMSGGALLAGSFTGSGLGLLVLFRTNRSMKECFLVLAFVYATGVVFGILFGGLL